MKQETEIKNRKSLFANPLWIVFYLLWWAYHFYLLSQKPAETPEQLAGIIIVIAIVPILLTIGIEIIIAIVRLIRALYKWIMNKLEK